MYILQSTLILFVTDQETPCIEPFTRITMRGDEKVQNMFWLFPIIFMFHEMEEIIGLRIWLDKNRDIVRKYNKVSMLYQNFSNEGFSIAVLEEYLLCIIITGVSIYFRIYIVWIGAFIVFSLHLLVHIMQSIIIKRYIPALASSIVLLPISIFLINKAMYTGGTLPPISPLPSTLSTAHRSLQTTGAAAPAIPPLCALLLLPLQTDFLYPSYSRSLLRFQCRLSKHGRFPHGYPTTL